jgi:hypothetical protein
MDMTIAEPLLNRSIERDQKYPLNSSHIDMGLILSKQGPLYENEFGDPDKRAYWKRIDRKLELQRSLKKSGAVESKNKGGLRIC